MTTTADIIIIMFPVILFCRYPVRIEAMQLKLEFIEKVADIKPAIVTLDSAMEELLLCDSLTELFHVALMAGNIINGVRY